MNVETMPIAFLNPDRRNARRGSVATLMDSLRDFGQHRPVVVQRTTNKIVVGNHMVQAALALGWTDIDVTWVDDDDEKAIRRALADNLVGDRAKWDDTQLAELLSELGDAAGSIPGMEEGLLERLLADVGPPAETPLLPIVARPSEGYDVVHVIADNQLDSVWLHEVLGLGRMRSYKAPTRVGVSRVITVDQLRSAMNEAVKRGQVV
jgi:hypothetical protein